MPPIYITLHMRTGLHGWAFNVLLALNIGQSLYPTSLDTVPPNHLKKMTCPSSCARHMTKLTKFNHTQPSWLQSINQSLSLSLCVQDPQILPLSLCTRPTDPIGSSLSPLIKPPNPFLASTVSPPIHPVSTTGQTSYFSLSLPLSPSYPPTQL